MVFEEIYLGISWLKRGGRGIQRASRWIDRVSWGKSGNRWYLKNNIIFIFLYVVCFFSLAGRLAGLLVNTIRIVVGFLFVIVCFCVEGRFGVVQIMSLILEDDNYVVFKLYIFQNLLFYENNLYVCLVWLVVSLMFRVFFMLFWGIFSDQEEVVWVGGKGFVLEGRGVGFRFLYYFFVGFQVGYMIFRVVFSSLLIL